MRRARLSGGRTAAHVIACAVVVVLCAWGSPACAQTPTPTPGGDCCDTHDGPGCDIPACQACVCGIDNFCCTTEWDGDCVASASAEDDCAAECACPTPMPTPTATPGGDCCAEHDGASCDDSTCRTCVCAIDDFCCTGVWDEGCADLAKTEGDCRAECPCKGDCCESQGAPGCQQPACATCVCEEEEPFCCTDDWDETCVEHANGEICGGVCACEGIPGDCCTGNDTPGCDEQACQACVCDEEPFCCSDVWDSECAARAANPEACGQICGCTGQIPSCCYAHQGSGCDNSACEACVCAAEDFCCSAQGGVWDNGCVETAVTTCADVCACGPTPASNCCVEHGYEGCGEVVDDACEECVCNIDDQCCSGPWDLTCVSEASNAPECTGDCLCQPRAVDDCCVSEVDGGCSNTVCETCVCAEDEFCCSAVWDRDCVSIAADECFTSCACQRPCIGDCFGLGRVSVSDVLTGLNIVLDYLPLASCPAYDYAGDGVVSVDELVAGVDASLNGCR